MLGQCRAGARTGFGWNGTVQAESRPVDPHAGSG